MDNDSDCEDERDVDKIGLIIAEGKINIILKDKTR
jgi:hypothetical protein